MKKLVLGVGLCLIASVVAFPYVSAAGPGDICVPTPGDDVCTCLGVLRYVILRQAPGFFGVDPFAGFAIDSGVVLGDQEGNFGVFVGAGSATFQYENGTTVEGHSYYMTGEAPNALECEDGLEHCLQANPNDDGVPPRCLVDIDACAIISDVDYAPLGCGLPK